MKQSYHHSRIKHLRALLAISILLTGATLRPIRASATAERDFANQVGYFTGPVIGSYSWEFRCVAENPAVKGQIAIASGTEFESGYMTGSMMAFARSSNRGRLIQVGEHELVFESRQEKTVENSSTFSSGGSQGSAGPGTAYVAWALWGGPATCTASLGGQPADVRYLPGTHAFSAGPESFETGAFAQDGGTHVSVARTLTAKLSGGAVFASMELGRYGEGFLRTDDWYNEPIEECQEPPGNPCSLARPHANELTAAITAAAEVNGLYQGQILVISLPPIPSEAS